MHISLTSIINAGNRMKTNKLTQASDAQNIQSYLFEQNGQTPVGNFIASHPFLQSLEIESPKINFLGYEVVSPKLRAFIKALDSCEKMNNKIAYQSLLAATIELMPLPEAQETQNLLESKTAYNELQELNKNMLIAVIKEDRRAFNKAFRAIEGFMCEIRPYEYIPGFANANVLYKDMCANNQLELQPSDQKLLLNTDNNSDDTSANFNTKHYFSVSEQMFVSHLRCEGYVTRSFSTPCSLEDEEKIDNLLISNAARVRKSQLEKQIPEQEKKVETLQHNYNKSVLNNAIGLTYFWIWCWSCIFAIAVGKNDKSETAKTLSKAKIDLLQMNIDLKKIKAAQGYLYGFYYTFNLQSVLQSVALTLNSDKWTDLYQATQKISINETFIQRIIINPISKSWWNIRFKAEQITASENSTFSNTIKAILPIFQKIILSLGIIDMSYKYKKNAAQIGSINESQQLFSEQDTDANDQYTTALILAAKKGYINLVQELSSLPDIDANAKDNTGTTALMYTAQEGHLSIAQLLLSIPTIDINTRNDYDETALILAAKEGHTSVAQQLLLMPDIDVNAGSYPKTALRWAIKNNDAVLAMHLLDMPNITDTYGYTKLMNAAHRGSADEVQELLSSGEDANARDQVWKTALMYAALGGNADTINKLLSAPKITINTTDRNNMTALMYAAWANNTDAMQVLLSSPDIDDLDNLYNDRWPVLMHAAQNGSADAVKLLLLVPGIKVNATNNHFKTALMCAAEGGHANVVEQLLLVPGLKVDATDTSGMTALMYAIDMDNVLVVRLLAKHQNIDINTILPMANLKVVKDLTYSGKIFNNSLNMPNHEFKITRSKNFLTQTKNMLASLNTILTGSYPHRISLLKASIYGLSYSETEITIHTGMSPKEFNVVHFMMRTAKLTNLIHGFNPYLAINMLISGNNKESHFENLCLDMKCHILNFLSSEDIGNISPHMSQQKQEPAANNTAGLTVR